MHALSIFVPGQWWNTSLPPADQEHCDGCICYWRNKSITIQDLYSLKFVGLSKKVTLSKAIEQYVSKWDFEKKSAQAPPYRGDILENIFSKKKNWPDEDTYLAYIHAVVLDVSIKSCLYYQIHIAATAKLLAGQSILSRQRVRSVSNASNPPLPVPSSTTRHKSMELKLPLTIPAIDALKMTEQHTTPLSPVHTTSSQITPPTSPSTMYSAPATPYYVGNTNTNSNNTATSYNPSPLGDIYAMLKNIDGVPDSPKAVMKRLGLRHHDITIAQTLAELIKEQQSWVVLDQMPETIRLDLQNTSSAKKKL